MKTKLTFIFILILFSASQIIAQDLITRVRNNEATIQKLQQQVNDLSKKLDEKERQLSASRKANYNNLNEKIKALSARIDNLEKELSITSSSTQQANESTANSMRNEVEKMRQSNETAAGTLQNQLVQMRQQIKDELEEAVSDITDFLENNTLPVGSILPYNGSLSELPDSWVLCDGSEVTDYESDFYGEKIPELGGYFIRGTEYESRLGNSGGQDNVSSHSHSISSHKHEVGSHTHKFSTDDDIYSNSYYDEVDITTGGEYAYILGGDSKSDLKHSHSGTTGNASSGHTQTSGSGSSGSAGSHDNRPKFKTYFYTIKIK